MKTAALQHFKAVEKGEELNAVSGDKVYNISEQLPTFGIIQIRSMLAMSLLLGLYWLSKNADTH